MTLAIIKPGRPSIIVAQGAGLLATMLRQAQLASDGALAASRYFISVAAGEAGSATNQFFSTDNGAGVLIYYKRTVGGSVEIGRAVTQATVTAIENSVTAFGASLTAYKSGDRATALSRLAIIEQLISGFNGRGMLDSEPVNVVSEQFITTVQAVGDFSLGVADNTKFVAGGTCVIKYPNGEYWPHYVSALGAGSISIAPALRYAVGATSKIERLWWNKAHPGKFYMRYLGQRIAHGREFEHASAAGPRVYFNDFKAAGFARDVLPVGTGTVEYRDFNNLGDSDTVASPIRYPNRSALVFYNAIGDGAETQFFPLGQLRTALARLSIFSNQIANVLTIKIIGLGNVLLAEYDLPAGASQRKAALYNFPFLPRDAKSIKIRVDCKAMAGGASYFAWSGVEVLEAPAATSPIIARANAKIVCLGDSWISGDLGGSLQREPITQQLALELPFATIINAGVGGNRITQLLTRFDADVAVHKPDYVVVNTGTNDVYFDPAATSVAGFLSNYMLLISKIYRIGARPIIIGIPGLAQSDATDLPGGSEWQLNNSARVHYLAFNEVFGVDAIDLGNGAESIGLRGAPLIGGAAIGAAYTFGFTDSGKTAYHTSATAHAWTIPANASVAFDIGTVIVISNENGGGIVTLSITTDTLRWGTSTGSRAIAANGTATLLKVGATTWRLTGDGIT